MTGPRGALRSIDAASWPAVASFCRGYLHQDAEREHGSMASAFEAFWADANDDERRRFLGEWDALMARVGNHPWNHVRRTLEALGTAWIAGGRAGFLALRRAIGKRSPVN